MRKLQLLFLFGIIATSLSAQADLEKAKSFMSKQFARFEENKGQIQDLQGQAAPYVRYHYTQGDKHIFMLPTGIAYQFNRTHYPEGYKHLDKFAKPEELETNDKLREQIRLETYRMDMELVGANPNAKIIAEERSADYINYYNKNALDVHSFQKLTYENIYPNIDWVIYSNAQGLKYDFVVHPGGNPAQIRLQFKNHENLKLNADGSFTLSNRMGTVSEEAPVSFQDKKAVPTRFVLEGDVISFDVANYNPNQTLVIDPNLEWATYYGGSGYDEINICVSDDAGNIYTAGTTESSSAIAQSGHQITYGGGMYDAFLLKMSSSGTRVWATYYGGSDDDRGNSCVVDKSGNIYFTGQTQADTLIAFSGHQNTFGGGSYDAFLAKFNSNGVRVWATYYGGPSDDLGVSCVTAADNSVYLAGASYSCSGISQNGHQNSCVGGNNNNAFLAKFDSSGARLWGTYYGGINDDYGYKCHVDTRNNVYLCGYTHSSSLIADNGHQLTYGGGNFDGFLVKFNSNGVRQWGTYYGGAGADIAYSCDTDAAGNIYVSGYTESPAGIALGGHQNTPGVLSSNIYDAFLVKFDSSGVRQWGTYYGGIDMEHGFSCSVDTFNNVYFVGYSRSYDAISTNFTTNAGYEDAFLVIFNSNGVRQWGTYYGGGGYDRAKSCFINKSGNSLLLAGRTTSSNLTISSAFQNSYAGGLGDAFLVKYSIPVSVFSIADQPALELYPNPTEGTINIQLGEVREMANIRIFDAAGRLLQSKQFSNLQLLTMPLEGPAGFYWVEVNGGSGFRKVLKVIKY